ncbi:MAG: chemotaxis-specific protein-glutamate methyltransferase CheB [Deltaproteobacteria bacterium]
MTKIRVMVVNDSVVVRRLISDVLSGDPEIEVVATASNGRVALQRLEQIPCDLLTLDVDMPDLDGIGVVTAVRKKYPKLPVIMFSALASRANLGAERERIKTDLIPKIKALCGVSRSTSRIPLARQITCVIPVTPPNRQTTSVIPVQRHTTGVIPVPSPQRPVTGVIDLPIPRLRFASAVAIGVSTGGPPALQTLIGALPASLSVPVFIVQHMPPTFTTMLAERLARTAAVPVVQAVAGMRVEAGKVYLAPGDYHLVIDRGPMGTFLRTNQDPPVCSCRPSVDVLFRSVSAAYGASALAIVLTGMGSDGTRGAEYIRAGGGTVLVQDQATSVVWGMPGSVARAGLAAGVHPIGEMAGEIVSRTQMRARETATGR